MHFSACGKLHKKLSLNANKYSVNVIELAKNQYLSSLLIPKNARKESF